MASTIGEAKYKKASVAIMSGSSGFMSVKRCTGEDKKV